jgi:ATP-binding cassette, subfamily C, bacterial
MGFPASRAAPMTRDSFALLLALADRRRLALILALAALGALTEGIGFVLLVPLLALVMDGGEPGGMLSPVSRWLEANGWQPSLGALLAGFALLVTLRAMADYVRVLAAMRLSFVIVDGLRERAFAALLAADWRTLSRMRQSENRAMLISEIDRTAIAIDQLGALVRIGIGLVAIGLAALAISPPVALAGAVAGALIFALYGGLRRRARSLGEQLSKQFRSVHGLLEENLDALRSIKSFGTEEAARQRMAAGFRALRQVRVRYTTDTLLARSLLQVGGAVLVALSVWLALAQWQLPAAIVLPLVALFARALPQFGALLDCWQLWAHASPAVIAAERLIRETEAAAEQRPGEVVVVPRLARAITLAKVSLAHRENVPTLHEVSLTIAAGETVALVGPSGAGKSTLADILGGLIAPDSGQMLIDGTPLDPAMRHGWRRQVAYVDQSPVLFHGSVRDNLRWAAPEASDARLAEVLEMAAAGFVRDLPGGLDCPLGERGRQLSGGERQRIVLARALLRDPALLILDEATSALDSGADEAVAQAIAGLAGRRTILIIGHRGALTDSATRVITLEAGRLVADRRRD